MKVYARLGSSHYHTTKMCVMLLGKEFDKMGYKEITWNEVRTRKLRSCVCVKKV